MAKPVPPTRGIQTTANETKAMIKKVLTQPELAKRGNYGHAQNPKTRHR